MYSLSGVPLFQAHSLKREHAPHDPSGVRFIPGSSSSAGGRDAGSRSAGPTGGASPSFSGKRGRPGAAPVRGTRLRIKAPCAPVPERA